MAAVFDFRLKFYRLSPKCSSCKNIIDFLIKSEEVETLNSKCDNLVVRAESCANL